MQRKVMRFGIIAPDRVVGFDGQRLPTRKRLPARQRFRNRNNGLHSDLVQ